MPTLHILSVGLDPHLMKVRTMLLRHAGHQVTEAFSASDAMLQLQSDSVDMMLICHTVARQDQANLLATARKKRRMLPVICITARETDGIPGCVNVENSPSALLDTIQSSASRVPG